jgi:hypothetical protein
MTKKADFSEQEWEVLREGPPTAGLIAASSSSGGTFRESWALAKALAEARQQHGDSELLDELVSERPHAKRYGSHQELYEEGTKRLGEAVALLEQKGTPDEVEDYRKFTVGVAEPVAAAHGESGQAVGDIERRAIDRITTALGS